MKKKFTFLMAAVMLLMMMGLPGNAVGQTRADEVYKQTIFIPANNNASTNSYSNDWSNTTDGFTNNITNVNNYNNTWNYIKMGSKSAASIGTIGTAAAIDKAITKVVLTIDAITASNVNSITLYKKTGSEDWESVGTFSKSTGAQTVTIASSAANLEYKIAVSCKKSSNGVITISKVEYYIAGTPTCTIDPESYNFGSSITAGSANLVQSFAVTTENLENNITVSFGNNDACYEKNVSTILSSATSTNIAVTFKPTDVGTHNNTLVLSSDDFDEDIVVPLYATVTCASAPTPLAFDDVNLVLEGVNVSINLSDLSPTGAGNGGDISYEMSTISGGSLDGSIFTATAEGNYVVTATQELNDIYCSETADINIHVVGTNPICTIDDNNYDFGSVGVYLTKDHEFTITTLNLGDGGITLSISDNHYSLSTTTIDEDGTTTLTITFEPTTTGVVEADLTISGCGFDDELLATIAGTGVQTYTVNFNPGLGGSGPSSVTNVEGYQITLEGATASTACQEDGGWTTFAGWTTATTLVNENTAPTPLYTSGSTYNIPNGGATLYAVYRKTNENNGSVTFSACGFSDGQAVSTVFVVQDKVSVTFDIGTNGSNAPKYYNSGTAIRCYGGNTFTISSNSGNLTAITLTFGSSDGSNDITTNVGTYSNGSWSGTASSVTFTIGGTSGNRRLASIAVTYGGSTSYAIAPSCTPQVKTPAFSVAEGFYTETQSVQISCETAGATIKYTTDGTTPSESDGLVYSSPVSVAQTTTIKAIAIYEGYDDSEVATATYTINNATHPYTVAQARDAIDADFGLTDVYARGIVSTAGTELSEGKITYSISDDGNTTTELQAYQGKNLNNTDFYSLDDIKVGDVVVIYGTLKKYGSVYEFQSGNYLYSITHTPTIIVSTEAVSDMVSIVGLEGDTDGENWSNAQSFIVSGSNLTNNITLTLSSTDDFEMSTNGSTYSTNSIQLNKDGDGNVGATTIYVRLKAGATEPAAQKNATITITSDGASNKLVALTGCVSYATLTYNGNGSDGGTVPTDNTNYTYNEEVEVASATMTRTGYEFAHWNTQADGQGANSYDPEDNFNITASTTLYAQWDAINYRIGKGTMVGGNVAVKIDNTEVTEAGTGSEVTLVVTPADNYSLATLTVNNDDVTLSPAVNSSVFTYTFTMPANDVTVVATFTKDPHTWDLSIASYNTPTSENQVTWHSAYADMVVDKANSSTAANNYLGGDDNNRSSSRFYKNSVLTITPADNYKINRVVFTATSTGYAKALQESSWTNAEATVDNTTVTITPTNKEEAVSATIGGTCGFTAVNVYYEFYIPVDGSGKMKGDVIIPSGEFVAVTSLIKVVDGQTLTVNGTLINTDPDKLIIEDGGQLILSNSNTGVQATVRKTTAASSAKVTSAWNAISSSVDNVEISTFIKDESGSQNQHNVYRYDEATVYWQEYRNTSNAFSNLTNGRGYLYRSLISGVEFSGDVNTGNIDCTDFLSWSCDEYGGRYKGFNLIGNPFTHDITWSNITNKENISGDGYYTLKSDGTWNTQTTGGTIAPMQAFLIQATGASPKLKIANTVGKGDDDKFGGDQIMFNVENSEYSDVAYVLFKKGHGLNKIEHRNDKTPMLYIINEDGDYAIADMPDNTSVINLGFEAKTMGQYTFSLKAEGRYSYMHLIDKLTGEDVDMLIEDSYTFMGSPRDRKDRFVLRLNYNAAGIDTESSIFAYQSGNEIIVSGEGELQIFDVMGRLVLNQRINGVQTINGINNGVYIFKLEGKTQKIVVR